MESNNTKKSLKDLSLIDQIEKVRTNNNVNWMDILRIAITFAPAETKKVLKKINQDDNKISELFKDLQN